MAIKLVNTAFTTGEISPEFFGRSDMQRYGAGLARAKNFFIDYRGGAVSRPGTEFLAPTPNSEGPPRLFRFRGTYVDFILVFTNQIMRVMKNGAFVREASKAITGITKAAPAIVTCVGHGYSSGDLIYIEQVGGMREISRRYYLVNVVDVNSFQLRTVDGANIDSTAYTTYTSGGNAARVYEIATPYTTAALETVKFEQDGNTVYGTRAENDVRAITYVDDDDWSLTSVSFNAGTAPGNLLITASASGTAQAVYCVSAVLGGVESLPCPVELSPVMDTVAGTTATLRWSYTGEPADYYLVYRSNIVEDGSLLSLGAPLGYIGRAYSRDFTDPQLTPDFTKSPVRVYNPFSEGGVIGIEVTNSGSSYAVTDTVALSDADGGGFSGTLVVDTDGKITGIIINAPGGGYTNPTVQITTSTGSGATFVVHQLPDTGCNPSVFKKFQQRGIWAATTQNPITIWGSRPGDVSNLNFSDILQEDDSFTYTLEMSTVKPIQHLLTIRSGLLCFTSMGVSRLYKMSRLAKQKFHFVEYRLLLL